MQVHLSLGVATLVALMKADRPTAGRRQPDADEAARIDAWLQMGMLPTEAASNGMLGKVPPRPT